MAKIKIIIFIGVLTLILGCSTNNDFNNQPPTDDNNPPTSVPDAPTLDGIVQQTPFYISLGWMTTSSNEVGFKIERKSGSGVYSIIGTTLKPIQNFSDNNITANTTYTYRVYAYNAIGNSPYSNEFSVTTGNIITLSTLTTTPVSFVNSSTAVSGGTILTDGGVSNVLRGVCWNTIPNPTYDLPTKTSNGVGLGGYTSYITGLLANTTYYVRAYATGAGGTAYGAEFSFTTLSQTAPISDIDGNIYPVVNICSNTWITKNLNVTHFRNGEIIPQVTNTAEWQNANNNHSPAWCYYNFDSNTEPEYGKLYNRYAVVDSRGLAPYGSRVPLHTDYQNLINCLGSQFVQKLEEAGTSHWVVSSTATNETGFTGLPGGQLTINSSGLPNFTSKGFDSYYWCFDSTTNNNIFSPYYFRLAPPETPPVSYIASGIYDSSNFIIKMYSVRLIKD